MKFKPILGSDLSGHVGGVVASHNSYGPYFRQRVRPVNKKTPAQQAQRTAIATISQTWRSLDPLVQAAWNAASVVKTSRKGDRVTLTGAAAFQFVNTLRSRMDLPIVVSPPSTITPPSITTPAVTMTSATQLSITFGPDAWNAANGGVIMSAALLTSAGTSFATPKLAVDTAVNPGTSPIVVALPFNVPLNARVRVLYHATAPDGRQSTYITTDTQNTAFAPTPPVATVVDVTFIGGNDFLWRFDSPITHPAPAIIAEMAVASDTTGTPTYLTPTQVLMTYVTAAGSGSPWALTGQPTGWSPVTFPDAGTTD